MATTISVSAIMSLVFFPFVNGKISSGTFYSEQSREIFSRYPIYPYFYLNVSIVISDVVHKCWNNVFTTFFFLLILISTSSLILFWILFHAGPLYLDKWIFIEIPSISVHQNRLFLSSQYVYLLNHPKWPRHPPPSWLLSRKFHLEIL